MSTRYLGEMGENTLRSWASQVGISANKADPDRTGWDFFLEFPDSDESRSITLPLDKLPRAIQCLIQVKSTDGQSGKRSVRLSNWVRLVKSPLPAFFLVLEFDSKDVCQRAYLVHVGEKYIYRVLKRLHELAPNMRTKLHKTTLQFKWSKANQLPSLSGKGLEEAIRNHVGAFDAYIEKKIQVLSNAGYEDGRWQFDFAIPIPPDKVDVQELLVDLSLGLISHLDVLRGSVRDLRFGVPTSEPTQTFDDGRVEIVDREVSGYGSILFTSPDKKRELRLVTEVYLPQGIRFELERKHVKARFAAPFVDFVFWLYQKNKIDIKFSWPSPDERYELARLQPVSSLILMLNEAYSQGSELGFEVQYNSEPFGKGQIRLENSLSSQILNQASTVYYAWTVVKHFDVHHLVQATPAELAYQKERLMFMNSVFSPITPSFRVIYESQEPLPNDGKAMCVPFATDVIIGQYRMAISAAIIGNAKPTGRSGIEGKEFEIRTNDVRLCREHLCDREGIPKYSLKDLATFVVDEYGETTKILILEGVNSHLLTSEVES